LPETPRGRDVVTNETCERDWIERYLLASKDVGDKIENSKDVGKSSSIQLDAEKTYWVESS
jgi:hypothetical protein